MLLASAAALFVSFMLSAETLRLARKPNQLLACDINNVLSCSDVAKSWQAELVKLGDLSFPNAFFGIAAESLCAVGTDIHGAFAGALHIRDDGKNLFLNFIQHF